MLAQCGHTATWLKVATSRPISNCCCPAQAANSEDTGIATSLVKGDRMVRLWLEGLEVSAHHPCWPALPSLAAQLGLVNRIATPALVLILAVREARVWRQWRQPYSE